ncbi:kinase-like protein [Schizophyllum commune H4-8]|uniref:kinase-like protein n=1 Tax=Schizophyllum commune (strain H4-8 / FGSC 9210) TaxID=578458 RepID=UPI00215E365A|nr:kinase-like protein [Schizophyllum commune H4-8]KAI5887614.1 kinase-like protein [Schizophyllum commune H4-8]
MFVARSLVCSIRWNALHAYLSVACLAIAAAASSPHKAYKAHRETLPLRTIALTVSDRTRSRRTDSVRSLGTPSTYDSGSVSPESTGELEPELTVHILPPFEYVKTLGSGAEGVVHLVRNTIGRRGVYAMKVIKNAQNGQAECEMHKHLTSLRLEYITEIYHEDRDVENIYMVMSYKPRGCLGDVLSVLHRLPYRRFMAVHKKIYVQYAAQIVGAVTDLHRRGILHRDIKPGNILVDEEGNLFLSDFGLAVELTNKPLIPAPAWRQKEIHGAIGADFAELSRSACGTPGYMAPELLVNNPRCDKPYGLEVDWYSVGATLYEIFVGPRELPYIPKGERIPEGTAAADEYLLNAYAKDLVFPKAPFFYTVPESKDLLQELLQRDPRKRLWCARDVCRHDFFKE